VLRYYPITNTMEHRNNADTPYHTKFFDVITIPAPELPLSPHMVGVGGAKAQVQKYNSIMFYEDTILSALETLKDGHNGSSVTAIKKHVQMHFLTNDQTVHEDTDDSSFLYWKDALFVQALKSLVQQQSIVHSTCIKNGSTFYKLSHAYKQHRTKELKDRYEHFQKIKALQWRKKQELSRRKEVPVRIPILRKGRLVEPKTVTIVDKYSSSNMDLQLEKQREKRSVLPRHELELHADDYTDLGACTSKKDFKSLRENLRIPKTKIMVKDVIHEHSKQEENK
jgi:hypothetical protein